MKEDTRKMTTMFGIRAHAYFRDSTRYFSWKIRNVFICSSSKGLLSIQFEFMNYYLKMALQTAIHGKKVCANPSNTGLPKAVGYD